MLRFDTMSGISGQIHAPVDDRKQVESYCLEYDRVRNARLFDGDFADLARNYH